MQYFHVHDGEFVMLVILFIGFIKIITSQEMYSP